MTLGPPNMSLRLGTAEAVEAINEAHAERHFHSRARPDVGAEIRSIRRAYQPGRAKLRAWLTHPDDRVAFEVLRRRIDLIGDRNIDWACAHILVRGLRGWPEQACWNPFLNWVTNFGMPNADAVAEWERIEKREAPEAARESYARLRKLREDVTAQVSESQDTEFVARFLAVPDRGMQRAAGKGLSAVPDWLLTASLHAERGHLALLNGLVSAGALSPSQADRVARHLVDTLLDEESTGSSVQAHSRILRTLDEAGHGLSPDQFQALLDRVSSEPLRVGSRLRELARTLAGLGQSGTPDQVRALYRRVGRLDWALPRLMMRRDLPIDIMREMAETTSDPSRRLQLARKAARFYDDPEVWDSLSRSKATEVEDVIMWYGHGPGYRRVLRRWLRADSMQSALKSLRDRVGDIDLKSAFADAVPLVLENPGAFERQFGTFVQLALLDADPARFRRYFRAVARLRPSDAAAVLEDAAEAQREAVEPEDLAPLLACGAREARATAIQHLGQLGFTAGPLSTGPIERRPWGR